jgi:small nuclear ribonucleoprotein G
MSKAAGADLKKLLEKRISVKINGNRTVSGVLRGFDATMNLSLYSAIEEASATERNNIGTIVIRGSSVMTIEPQERV